MVNALYLDSWSLHLLFVLQQIHKQIAEQTEACVKTGSDLIAGFLPILCMPGTTHMSRLKPACPPVGNKAEQTTHGARQPVSPETACPAGVQIRHVGHGSSPDQP